MRLKVTLNRGGGSPATDLLVTVDTTVTVGELASTLADRDPSRVAPESTTPTIRIDEGPGRVLRPQVSVADAGLRSGQTVTITDGGGRFAVGDDEPTVATLHVIAGPDAGRSFPLRSGANEIGRERGNDVVLTDPLVSKAHARVNVGDVVEVLDLGSANGVLIGGEQVPRAIVRPDDELLLGDSLLRIQRSASVSEATGGVEFNRSPRLDSVYEGSERELPEPPKPPQHQRLPIIQLIAPIVMGIVLYSITKNAITIAFVAMSPIMVLGNVIENRVFNKRAHRKALEEYDAALVVIDSELAQQGAVEAAGRRAEHPALDECLVAAKDRDPRLWSRRPDQRGFLEIRVGLGALPARNQVTLPRRGEIGAEHWNRLLAVQRRHSLVADVPVVASLIESGSVGIAGPRAAALASTRACIASLVCLHSPAEVVLAGMSSGRGAEDWDWLKWVPHVGSDHSPLPGHHLTASPGGAARLVSALDELLDERLAAAGAAVPVALPRIVLLVDDAPIERSRLVDLAERGRDVGIHLVWVSPTVADLPAACRTFIDLDPGAPTAGTVGYVESGLRAVDVAVDQLDPAYAATLGRGLAPVVDAGAPVDDDSDLPRSVSLVTLAGAELLAGGDAVVDRWRTSSSIPAEFAGVRRKKDHNLRAFVGAAAGQSFVLDLREHGPHALVGGTTGSGKSEFLQSWVLGLALEHSPARVTFLFVDYKGGAAFSECVNLPHSVGLVTDLSPHLVRRALTSLNAELRHREGILQAKKAKDLLELERRGDADAPPSLVIVVDEFAALVKEVPEFVDGVVNVAQRGRSLGLHLVLATQRPAGVIKDNLRANTNLRIALRMADDDDSTDVVGSKLAGGFDPSLPGRGVAKMGPGRLTPFQSGYVGGWTSDTPPPPVITVEELAFGVGGTWEAVEAGDGSAPPTGPTDLERLVASVREAHQQLALEPPRRPWLDTLADTYDLARSPQSRTDSSLIFGVADAPASQQQVPVAFHPDRDGNMAVYGTGGAGKSGFLRTLAIVAGLGLRGGPCHVYGLDFGARGLQMLEPLPHVGSIINGDDSERVQRLLRQLRETIDDRAARYAAVRAGTIDEYRTTAEQPDEPRILLLVDGMGAFRQAYETAAAGRWFEMFQQIAADGRQVGVHVVVSADRPSAIPTALGSVIQRQLILRLASENDYLTLNAPVDVIEPLSPPGRGMIDDLEVQVTVLGGSANNSRQATTIEQLAAELTASTDRSPAPPIERLIDRVTLDQLPAVVDGLPTLGLADDTLGPLAFVPEDILLVVGPPQSGKTSVMATIALSLHRAQPGRFVYLGAGRSMLRSVVPWAAEAVGVDAVADLARSLADQIASGGSPSAIFLEDLSAFLTGAAEVPLQDLLRVCRGNGVFVATDCETSALASWPLHMAAKAARHGIALQPDQFDGDAVFKTPFPRVSRAEFPPGRGIYVRRGAGRRFQAALPELEPG